MTWGGRGDRDGRIQPGFMGRGLASAARVKDVKVTKMTTACQPAALPVLALLGALAVSAPASANCDWYVKTSLEQQQRNAKLKCGFSGAEWSVDKGAHAAWCATVSPDASRATAQKREADLAKCSAK
jgi:3-hydroxyisobutyrate dehydrogenase-like beta-hydroxyacid dehydrogenase